MLTALFVSLFVELRFLTLKRVEYILKIFKSEGTVNLIKLFFRVDQICFFFFFVGTWTKKRIKNKNQLAVFHTFLIMIF